MLTEKMASTLTFLLALALVLVFVLSVITVLHDCLVYRDLRRRLIEEEKRQAKDDENIKRIDE